MSKLVGVLSQTDIAQVSFKKLALMFHQLALPAMEYHIQQFSDVPYFQFAQGTSATWLLEQGIIFDPLPMLRAADIEGRLDFEELQTFDSQWSSFAEGAYNLLEKNEFSGTRLVALQKDYEKRRLSITLRHVFGLNACALSSPIFLAQLISPNLATVAHVVLKHFPVPSDSTPWEQIIDFRADPESRGKFLDLQEFMNEMVRAAIPPIEIEQKLEYLTSQYQRHMALHQMKTNSSMLETIIVSGTEMLENFMTLRWSRIAKSLFSYRTRKIALLEGELTAPGSQVAYILTANKRFTDKL